MRERKIKKHIYAKIKQTYQKKLKFIILRHLSEYVDYKQERRHQESILADYNKDRVDITQRFIKYLICRVFFDYWKKAIAHKSAK